MRVEQNIDRDTGEVAYDVYVRQSWLKEALGCPDKARRLIAQPEWSVSGNEYTSMGTAVHAGIEPLLHDPTLTVADVLHVAHEQFDRSMDDSTWFYMSDRRECHALISRCLASFDGAIRPRVEGRLIGTEVPFQVPLFFYESELAKGVVRVWGEGTIDCVTDLQLWDWKTAGKSSFPSYKGYGKQAHDVQSTMYSTAAVAMGHLEWPVLFSFGVMNRSDGSTLICDVDRDRSHLDWMMRQIKPFVEMWFAMGPTIDWPLNDQYEFCGRWCPFHSVCRGCYSQ